MMISSVSQSGGNYPIRKQEAVKSASVSGGEATAAAAVPSDSANVAFNKSQVNVAGLLATTAEAAAQIESALPEHVPGEVIVKLKPDFAFSTSDKTGTLGNFAQDYGGEVSHRFDIPENMFKSFNGEMMIVKLPAGMSTAQAMAAMAQDERVEYAASNDIVQAGPIEVADEANTDSEAKELNKKLWGLNNEGQTGGTVDADIDAKEAWGKGFIGATQAENGPLIAVIDTGVNYKHEALQGNIWTNPGEIPGNGIDDDGNGVIDDVHGFNASATDKKKAGDPLDDNDHGSHCAGTIGGNGENSQGLYGVMHKANIMGVKFLTANGGGTLKSAIDSVLYATKMGARITSNSWGGGGFNQALYDAFKASPAMHIIAAGNERNNNDANPAYPATFDLPNVISVAATDHNNKLANFSNYGATTVDLAAPGVDILSATSKGDKAYASFSGTSMATPHVTGVAGAILTEFPEMGNDELKSLLMGTVDKVPGLAGKMVTGGVVNVNTAFEKKAADDKAE